MTRGTRSIRGCQVESLQVLRQRERFERSAPYSDEHRWKYFRHRGRTVRTLSSSAKPKDESHGFRGKLRTIAVCGVRPRVGRDGPRDCKAFEMRWKRRNQLSVVGILHKSLASIIEFEQPKVRGFTPVEASFLGEREAASDDRELLIDRRISRTFRNGVPFFYKL
jgi:hypothetical protein